MGRDEIRQRPNSATSPTSASEESGGAAPGEAGIRGDGDAGGFPVGTPVFAIEGFSPEERLTAEQDGGGFVVLEVEN